MIPNGEGWNYIAVKQLRALLKNIKAPPDFYCLNYFDSFRTENKLESHISVCKNQDFCNIVMPSEDT